MSAQHTPGPWVVNTAGTGDSKGRVVIDEIYVYAPESGADDVAVAADIADPLTGLPSEANARLIAAAPDLLEVLKLYSLPIDTNNIALSIIEFGTEVVERELKRRAAIAKATGAA